MNNVHLTLFSNPLCCTVLAVLLAPVGALAQLPTQTIPAEAVSAAQTQARNIMEKQAATQAQRTASPSVPEISTLPQPAVTAPLLQQVLENARQKQAPQINTAAPVDCLLFVSFSMPKAALERSVQQAEKAGATLVFRGLKGDSVKLMGEAVQQLIGERQVAVAIHPPAFTQFDVTSVPAVVLAKRNVDPSADAFIKVSGDVSLEYALDTVERQRPAWADEARRYRAKIVQGIE